jgi:hypothetical protein
MDGACGMLMKSKIIYAVDIEQKMVDLVEDEVIKINHGGDY